MFSSLFLPLIVHAATFFVRDLRLGATGVDVQALQQLLNRDTATLVASFGPGSPGQESQYFGPATRSAVIRFQDKYATEVLYPAGLYNGTGFVGPLTRNKLNNLLFNQVAPIKPVVPVVPIQAIPNQPIAQPTVPVIQIQPTVKPVINGLSPLSGPAGTVMTITGSGFSPANNTIVASYGTLTNIPSADGKTITLTIPALSMPERAKARRLPLDFYFAVEVGKDQSEFYKFTLTR